MLDYKKYLENVINDPNTSPGEVSPSFILEFQERCYIITCEKLRDDLAELGIRDGIFINVITEETRDLPSTLDKNRVFLFHENKPRKNSAASKTIEDVVEKIFPGEKFGLPTRRGLTSLIRPKDLTLMLENSFDDIMFVMKSIDESSIELYTKLLAILKNGKKSLVEKYISPIFKMYNELVVPTTGDTVISGGLYNQVEVSRIINQIGPTGKLIGFEPSYDRFLELKDLDIKNFIVKSSALYAGGKRAFARFQDVGFDSQLSNIGKAEVPLTTIDSELRGEKCDLIKLNINGSELDAILGSKRTISKYKPKIQVLLTLENIVEIPRMLLNYNNEYTFYVGYYDRFNNFDNIILYAI